MLDKQKQQLVLDNIGLVYYVSNKFNLRDEDLIQNGFVGLCRAADSYKVDRGVCFSTYAYYQIYYCMKGDYSEIKNKQLKMNHSFINVEDSKDYICSNSESLKNNAEEVFADYSNVYKKLPQRKQRLLNMMYSGYSKTEIAKDLHISNSCVTKWIAKIKEDLIYEKERNK